MQTPQRLAHEPQITRASPSRLTVAIAVFAQRPRARRFDMTTLSFAMTWPSCIAVIQAAVEVTAAKLLWNTTLKTRWISSALTLPAAFS